jgi:hypothetical protein
MTLAYLIHKYRNHSCSIKRDTIYSLLALCSDGHDIDVQYNVPAAQVLLHVLEATEAHLYFCGILAYVMALDVDLESICGYVRFRSVAIRNLGVYVAGFMQDCACTSVSVQRVRKLAKKVDGATWIFCPGSPNCPDARLHMCIHRPFWGSVQWEVYVVAHHQPVAIVRYSAHVTAKESYPRMQETGPGKSSSHFDT